jgi:hypothetical protein
VVVVDVLGVGVLLVVLSAAVGVGIDEPVVVGEIVDGVDGEATSPESEHAVIANAAKLNAAAADRNLIDAERGVRIPGEVARKRSWG